MESIANEVKRDLAEEKREVVKGVLRNALKNIAVDEANIFIAKKHFAELLAKTEEEIYNEYIVLFQASQTSAIAGIGTALTFD